MNLKICKIPKTDKNHPAFEQGTFFVGSPSHHHSLWPAHHYQWHCHYYKEGGRWRGEGGENISLQILKQNITHKVDAISTSILCCSILAGNFHLEKMFTSFTSCSHGWNFYPKMFCPTLMITKSLYFYPWVKIYNSRIAGLGKNFSSDNIQVYGLGHTASSFTFAWNCNYSQWSCGGWPC